jgi:MFS family permease
MARSKPRLVPDLPRNAWVLVAGACACYVAVGYVSAFLVLYLHYARGIPLGAAGIALGAVALAGLVCSPAIGSAADRWGPKPTMLVLLVLGAVGAIAFMSARSLAPAVLASALYGIGVAGMAGPEFALLATLVRPAQRSAAFAMHYSAMSLGLSLGALGGGLLVHLDSPTSFEIGFALATLPFAVYAVVLLGIRSPVPEPLADQPAPDADIRPPAAYRQVFADRTYLLLLVFLFCAIVFAGGQFEVAYPSYAVGVGHVSARVIGYSFAFGSVTVILGTMFVLRALAGRRRTYAAYLAAVFASGCWLLVLAAAHAGAPLAAVGMCVAMIVFAVAEAMYATAFMPMVNDIAPDDLRGRYNAMVATIDGAGRVVAPLFAGFLLQAGLGDGLMVLLAGGIVLAIPIIRAIERRLPPEANMIAELAEELPVGEALAGPQIG